MAPPDQTELARPARWHISPLNTTVGYGDRYPIRGEGRVVAGLLMIAGVGLFGTFSGYVASWFLVPADKKEQSDIDMLRAEIASLRDAIERRAESRVR